MRANEFIVERLGPHNYREADMLIAGTKPAAISLRAEDMKKLAPYIKSGQLIARREFSIQGWSNNIGGWIVGQANNQAGVDALYELLKAEEIRNDDIGWYEASKLPNTEYHTKLGRLLGYTEDDINFAHNKWEKMRQAKRDTVRESLNIDDNGYRIPRVHREEVGCSECGKMNDLELCGSYKHVADLMCPKCRQRWHYQWCDNCKLNHIEGVCSQVGSMAGKSIHKYE